MSTAPAVELPSVVDVIRPREHGSWSLVIEPLALGLLIAPRPAGFAFAMAVLAVFFARRPLRLLAADTEAARRRVAIRALSLCAALAIAAFGAALAIASWRWVPWTLPTAMGGAAFLYFDLRRAGREQAAEIAGSCAFAWLPAVFAAIAGSPSETAIAMAAVMLARALPTVLVVRAAVRARKANQSPSVGPALTAILALAGIASLARAGLAPWTAFLGTGVLAVRAFLLLVAPRPALRASTIGMVEAILGATYVLAVGLAW